MKQYCISFYGSSGDGYVAYDNSPCISLDMAMTFSSENEAKKQMEILQKDWCSELRVCEVDFD